MVDLWKRCFRALDDVKESVRTAAQVACKRLGKLSVSLCSRDRGSQGAEAVEAILPCLIHDGLLTGVDDIRMFSLTILIDLAKEAGPQLKPHITEFALVLLESLSGLEAPVLNYMANRLSKESGNQDRLDDVRLAVSKSVIHLGKRAVIIFGLVFF